MQEGWPDEKEDTHDSAKPYFHFRDEITYAEGIVFKGERAIIPVSLRYDMMERIHSCHLESGRLLKKIPNRPWAEVGTDLFHFDNNEYLITVDYFSNFWEIDYFQDTISSTIIKRLNANFARHGIPDTCISDNGPQFSSDEFKRISKMLEFVHKTSSPGFPQSNGKAEQAVKTAKSIMKKRQRIW